MRPSTAFPRWLIVGMLLSVSCGRDAVHELAECYRLEHGPWSGAHPSGIPEAHEPPPVFRLGTDSLPELPNRTLYRVYPNLAYFERQGTPIRPRWFFHGTDSLGLEWSNGFVGVVLRLDRQADVLHGVAHTYWDEFVPNMPTAKVRAYPVQCPAELSSG